jgi:membrane peptidoglycan carboxypeptidase
MRQRTGTFRTLCVLAVSIVAAGALLAGLLLPWVGGPAVAAQRSTGLLGDPPEELTDQPPAGNTTMLAANGELITSFYRENRAPIAGDQIAEIMRQAMVAVEDARFYEHGGLDVQGTLRALVKNLAAGEVQEGGSTLTQQLVKQTLLQATDDPVWPWRWRIGTARRSCSPATSTSSTSAATPTASSPPRRRTSGWTPRL